jgi:hypothetical protein
MFVRPVGSHSASRAIGDQVRSVKMVEDR